MDHRLDVFVADDDPSQLKLMYDAAVTALGGVGNVSMQFSNQPAKVDEVVANVVLHDYLWGKRRLGLQPALRLADRDPSRLVVLKTAGAYLEDDVYELANLKQLDGKMRLSREIQGIIREWIGSFGWSRTRGRRLGTIQLDRLQTSEAERDLVQAASAAYDRHVSAREGAAVDDGVLAILRVIGDRLWAEVEPDVISADAFLEIPMSADRVVPWETCCLRRDRDVLDLPVLRVRDTAGGSHSQHPLGSVLYVFGPDVDSDVEHASLERVVKGWGGNVTAVTIEEFLSPNPLLDSFGTIHLAMHGPAVPEPPANREVLQLQRAIASHKPRLLVANACHSFSLLGAAERRYPITTAPLAQLLDGGIEALVLSQFVLGEEMVPDWVDAFYSTLFLTYDVAVSVAAARKRTADQLWELAPVAFARRDSGLWYANHDVPRTD